MKADTINFSLGSVYNGKLFGNMTYYEARDIAYDLIMVKQKCKRMVISQKQDGEEKVVFVFTKEDFL
ncbi:MAG: hypothetical protein ACI3ZP_05595 [Candidatus Cryptobacteroides sp.]